MPTEPHFSQKSQKVLDLEARIKELESYIAVDGVTILIAERDSLKGWKESAQTILNSINFQEVGKELELRLGSDVGPMILPRIRDLKKELALITAVAEGREQVPLEPSTPEALRAVQKVVQSRDAAYTRIKDLNREVCATLKEKPIPSVASLSLDIFCAYCGCENVHSQDCIRLRQEPPKTCPKCSRDQMHRFKSTPWYACDHCGFSGYDPNQEGEELMNGIEESTALQDKSSNNKEIPLT